MRRTTIAAGFAAVTMGAAGLAAFTVPAQAATTTSSTVQGALGGSGTSAGRSCDRAPWEAKVEGQPRSYHAGAASGDYLWHSSDGFHLRVTHGNSDQRVYTGTITSSAPMRIDAVKLESGDKVVLSQDRKTMAFEFANHGYIDGVNFHTDCASALTVSRLHVGNSNESVKQVYLGYYGQHPSSVPFSVHRYSNPA